MLAACREALDSCDGWRRIPTCLDKPRKQTNDGQRRAQDAQQHPQTISTEP